MANRLRDSKGRYTTAPAKKSNGKTNGTNGAHVRNVGPVRRDSSLSLEDRVLNSSILNLFQMSRKFWTKMLESRKNIEAECDYPETEALTSTAYRHIFDRDVIGRRIVSLYPEEAWMMSPSLFEKESGKITTPFETDWDNVAKTLNNNSWYQAEDAEGHPLWEYCRRGNILSRICSYGGLLLGTDHKGTLDTELQFKPGKKTNELLYVRAFDESTLEIAERDEDNTSKRFKQPVYYNITVEGNGGAGDKKRVHWTRIVHLADNIESSEVETVPTLRPYINRVIDLRKLLGGSAEMYWRGALPPIFLGTDPKLGLKVGMKGESKDAFEAMMESLQRYAFIPGVIPHQLAPSVSDPSKQIAAQIEAICILLGCPVRIFIGSERGELASSQDTRTWNNRLAAYQTKYLIPRLIVPLVDRLINIGVLTAPKNYRVIFPDLNTLTPMERAQLALSRTDSLVKFIQGDGEAAMTFMDFWTYFHDFSQEDAQGIVDRAMAQEETLTDPLAEPEVLDEFGNPIPPAPNGEDVEDEEEEVEEKELATA